MKGTVIFIKTVNALFLAPEGVAKPVRRPVKISALLM